MKPASPKVFPGMTAFPRTVYSISVSVGGLALFLVFGSWLLLSYPIGSALQGYFLGIDHSRKFGISLPVGNETLVLHYNPDASQYGINKKPSSESGNTNGSTRNSHSTNSSYVLEDKEGATSTPVSKLPSDSTGEKEPINSTISANISEAKGHLRSSDTGSSVITWASSSSSLETSPPLSYLSNNSGKVHSGSCNLYQGKWFYDSSGPLYTNNTCPVLTQTQNCQGNGRPDKDYENWRWKPSQCDLPRFDAKKFLELMRGKTLVFIGDSVARNQMESMLCILWQVEVPRNRGNRKMQRWYFKSTSFTLIRIWSSWLVHQTSEPFDFAPEGVVKIHLDIPDESFMDLLPSFDVVILSSGHWFAKQSVYILNNEIVGGQLWWPHKSRPMKVNNVEAFGISIETILTAMATHPNYTGLTIVRSYSPDHYEGGAWNTGGSCTGKVRPAKELVSNGFTDIMYAKQVKGFNSAIEKVTGRLKLRLMDITEVFGYRHDGHPGPYRSPDPNKKTRRGPHGEPPPQDCLHWCMPGPVDTWNELVLEIIRREFEGNESVRA